MAINEITPNELGSQLSAIADKLKSIDSRYRTGQHININYWFLPTTHEETVDLMKKLTKAGFQQQELISTRIMTFEAIEPNIEFEINLDLGTLDFNRLLMEEETEKISEPEKQS